LHAKFHLFHILSKFIIKQVFINNAHYQYFSNFLNFHHKDLLYTKIDNNIIYIRQFLGNILLIIRKYEKHFKNPNFDNNNKLIRIKLEILDKITIHN